MARILFVPETFNLGETTRAIEIARAVRRLGHDVHFVGYSRRFSSRVTNAGFSFDLLNPELSEAQADMLIAADQGRSIRHPFTTAMLRQRVASERAVYDQWEPDGVVIGSTFSTFISARAAGIPLIYAKPYAMSLGHLGTLRSYPLCAETNRAQRLVNQVAGSVTRMMADYMTWKPRAFRQIARENGVELPRRTIDAISADRNLVCSLQPVLFSAPMGPREAPVGPVYSRSDEELPTDILDLARKRSRPIVYVGMGSSARPYLVKSVLEQLSALNVDVIAAVGKYFGEGQLPELPANVRVWDFLPAQKLAGIIDGSVIHGGEGTVQTACASGAPFAGMGLQAEQRWNVEMCVKFGNAVSFNQRSVKRNELPLLVTEMVQDSDLRTAAQRMKEHMDQLNGAAESARLIMDFIDGG